MRRLSDKGSLVKLFALELPALARFLAGFDRIPSRDLFIPGRMKRPRPGFADSAANHGLKCARLADRAEVNVNEDPAQHDHGGDIVQHVTDRDRPASKRAGTLPENDASDYKNHAPRDNLPELRLLSTIEKASLGWCHLLFSTGNFAQIPHPPGVGRTPRHRRDPVQHLQSEENHKSHTKPGMQLAAQCAATENGGEPAEKPG